jgi:Zn-finger in ubiquitin-hydrolases and other protein
MPNSHRARAMSSGCQHLDVVADVSASSDGCEDCLRTGDQWVHLRLCMSCGYVGCCDSSPTQHATAHWSAIAATPSSGPTARARTGGGATRTGWASTSTSTERRRPRLTRDPTQRDIRRWIIDDGDMCSGHAQRHEQRSDYVEAPSARTAERRHPLGIRTSSAIRRSRSSS